MFILENFCSFFVVLSCFYSYVKSFPLTSVSSRNNTVLCSILNQANTRCSHLYVSMTFHFISFSFIIIINLKFINISSVILIFAGMPLTSSLTCLCLACLPMLSVLSGGIFVRSLKLFVTASEYV